MGGTVESVKTPHGHTRAIVIETVDGVGWMFPLSSTARLRMLMDPSPAAIQSYVQFDVPVASLPPGLYTCQVNVIDDAAGTFAFPRIQLYVRK